MTSRDFCYWLQGFIELESLTSNDPAKLNLTEKQFQCVKNHLNMVFKHEIDPSMGSIHHQEQLSDIHQGLSDNSQQIVRC